MATFNMYVHNLFLSAYCCHCNFTIGVNALLDGPIKCPSCGREMVAGSGQTETNVISMVSCKKCGTAFGLMSLLGDSPKCPTCGQPSTP